MFSDSIKDAKKESHRKVSNLMFWFFSADLFKIVGGKPKVKYYCAIVKVIFDAEGEPECTTYLLEPEHYTMSVMGQISQ